MTESDEASTTAAESDAGQSREQPDETTPEGKHQQENGHETQDDAERFNWKLPLFGAIGFGIGFALRCAIGATYLSTAQIVFDPSGADYLQAAILRGILVGGVGGAALGLAFSDRKYVPYFSLAGGVGFAIAFAVVISLDVSTVPDIGREIIRLMGGPGFLSTYETALAHGLGMGTIVGAAGRLA